MTRLWHTIVPTHSPPEDGQHAAVRVDHDGAGRRVDWEQRARDAEDRADEAEQRADAGERRIEALLRALDSRESIDQAKGIVMGVFGLEPEAAFEALVWVSQNANVKLATVAERLLVDVRGIDLSRRSRDQLTHLLATMGRPDEQHFT